MTATAVVSQQPGAESTTRPKANVSAEEVNNRRESSLECHLLFFHELAGGMGNGFVPPEDKARSRYFRDVRGILKREYGFSDEEVAWQLVVYKQVNGPSMVRRELILRRGDKHQDYPE